MHTKAKTTAASAPALDSEKQKKPELPDSREIQTNEKIGLLLDWLDEGFLQVTGQVFSRNKPGREDMTPRIHADVRGMYVNSEYQSWRSVLRQWNGLKLSARATSESKECKAAARLASRWLKNLFDEVDEKLRQRS